MADFAGARRAQQIPLGKATQSLPGLVADQLSGAILNGDFEPGERLKEESIADRFAVSRTAVREAIALLEARGMVERIPRYGARVRVINTGEIEEIFAVRAQLLALAVRVIAKRASDDTLANIQQHTLRIRQLADNKSTSPAMYAKATIEAQQLLMNNLQWKQLSRIYEDLSNQVLWQMTVRGKSLSFQTPSRRRESAADWELMTAAIIKRDQDAAEQSAKQMLQRSYQAVKKLLCSTALIDAASTIERPDTTLKQP